MYGFYLVLSEETFLTQFQLTVFDNRAQNVTRESALNGNVGNYIPKPWVNDDELLNKEHDPNVMYTVKRSIMDNEMIVFKQCID